jgi:hypothetical protein
LRKAGQRRLSFKMLFNPKRKRFIKFEEFEKLRAWYKEQLLRKDNEIKKLKAEKEILLKTALKQAELSLSIKKKKKS